VNDIAAATGVTVDLAELRDRRLYRVLPPRTRLYLYLRIKTRDGRDPVRLTDEVAVALGLPRNSKATALRQLERADLVRVDRARLLTPLIRLVV
jgi:hypothetical protein